MIMNTVKLQVPIEKDVRDKWEGYARRNGFDSLQAYIRFLAKADIDGRRVNLEESVSLSPAAEARYAKEIDGYEAAHREGSTKNFQPIDELIDTLSNEAS